jgi:hypothetical protein
MLGERQDPLAGLLIRRNVDRGERADSSAMSTRSADGANAMLCPACARSMIRVRTIWRTFQDDLQVFECRACNVSVSARVSPRPK